MALKKCIKATSNLNQEDVAAVLENFDSYSGTMTQAEATALAVDDAIASVNQERSDTLAEIIRLNPSLVPTPVEPEAPIDQALIVSPLDPKSSQRAKARQLRKLGEENEKIITPILKEIDEIFGTESGISHKTLAKMVSKANRPSVKARKTWHDVEHVRDGFRFKTVLEDFSRLPEIIEHLAGNGIEIIKADTDKMLTPGSWGWRIASFDMRMPNGQIVEWYLPVQELEEAKKGLGHDLFEKWRDFDTEKLTPEQMDAFDVDVDASNDLYNDAWNTFLRRTGQRESELRASFSKASSLEVSLNRMKSLYSSVIENTESLNQTPPNLVPWNPLNKTTQSSPSRAKKTKGLRINSTSKNILSQVAAYLQPEQDHISVREGKKVANSEEAPGDFIQRSAQPETKPKTAVTTASLKNSIYKLQRIAPVTQKLDFMVYENQDEYFGPGSVERIGIIQGGFIVGTNEIVLFADNIPSKAVATALIRHEVVGHFGLRELLNRDGAYDKLLNRVYQARNADLKEEYNWVAKYYPKLIADKNVAGIADEMIARAAETKTQIGKLITKIYDQIIKLLNQFGLATADMTQKELKALIRVSESNLRRQLNTRENRMAETQVVSARMMEQTDTPQFLAWAGTDVVTPSFDLADFNFQGEGPFVMTAYHGTTHDIESFNSQVRGNTENHFGEMNYFTSDQGDADMNYAGEGPDLTARIEQRKEDIEREIEENEQDPEIEEIAVRMMEEQEYVYDNAPAWEDMPDDIRNEAIDEYARKDLEGDSPQTLKVYLKTENPFVVNGDKTMNASPSRHYFEFYDQEAIEEAAVNNVAYDNDVEPADILADRETYEEAIQEASYEQMDNEPNKLVDAIEMYSRATEQQIYEAMSDAGLEFNEASHDQIENFLRNSDFLQDEVGDNGEYMSSDLTGKIIRELGFDSIIMKNAGKQFPGMSMGGDTVHISMFDANNTNIKSVDNTGTFDPNDSRIMFRKETETPEFKAWFGNSQVVENGNPKVMYRGERGDSRSYRPNDKGIIYLAGEEALADQFAKGGMGMPIDGSLDAVTQAVYVKAENIIDVINNKKHRELFMDLYAELSLPEAYIDGKRTKALEGRKKLARAYEPRIKEGAWSFFESREMIERLKAEGFDGFWNYEYPLDTVPNQDLALGVFSGEQMKSATDNSGAYDPNNPDMRFRKAAEEADAAPVGSSLGMPEENWREKFVRLFQDGFNRMLRAQEIITEGGGDATGDKNVYRAEELSHDQIGSRIRKFGKDYRDPLRKVMRPNSITLDELDAYLTAQHAPERNAWIASFNDEMPDGGSGMTNAEAAKIRSVLSQREGMDEAAAIVRSVNDLALDDMVEGGHITQEFADDLRARWTYYVPLKGIEGQEIRPGLGSGYSVVGSGIKKAMGRGAGNRAESPTAHSFAGAETTIVRTGKTKIGQALVNLIRANPDPELWTIGKRTAKRFRTIFGEAFDGYETAPEGMIENIDYHRVMGFTEEELMNADMEGRKPEKKAIWRIDQNYKHRDDVFGVMIAGEEILVNIKDPVLIEQLKKMNVTQMNLAVRTAGTVNRYLAMINTALNPEFVITNFERDFQTAMINLGGEHSPAIAARVAKGLPGAIRGIWQATFDTKGDSEWRTLFNEMQEEGGTIGFFGLEDIETKVKKIRNGLIEKHGVLGKTMQGIEAVRDVVLDANLSVENAARLSAYKVMKEEALAKGVSMKEAKAMAASVAKNLTVNFNRKGELAPVLNSAFLFYNASIQGSFRIFTALKSPAVRKIVGGVMVAGFVNALFNRGVGGDDDDEIARWDKMSDFNKQTNIIFMHPDGSGEATKIKLPYGYNVFWYAGSAMADMMFGPKTVMNTAMNMAAAMLNAFNPINGSDFLDTITPTIVKPLAQHIRNENFMGAKVKPEYPFDNYTRPESQKFYPSTNKGLVELTTWLNEATGGDETHPGALDFSPETIKHYTGWLTGGAGLTATRTLGTALNLATGEPIEARNVPGLRTVTTKQSAYFDKERYYNAIREVNAVQAQLKIYRGTDEWGEYREEHSEVHALALHMKRYKNNVKRLRVLTDKAYADEDRETARELTEEIRQEMMEFSTMYDEAIADQGS
jgi:hypothetical protein